MWRPPDAAPYDHLTTPLTSPSGGGKAYVTFPEALWDWLVDAALCLFASGVKKKERTSPRFPPRSPTPRRFPPFSHAPSLPPLGSYPPILSPQLPNDIGLRGHLGPDCPIASDFPHDLELGREPLVVLVPLPLGLLLLQGGLVAVFGLEGRFPVPDKPLPRQPAGLDLSLEIGIRGCSRRRRRSREEEEEVLSEP